MTPKDQKFPQTDSAPTLNFFSLLFYSGTPMFLLPGRTVVRHVSSLGLGEEEPPVDSSSPSPRPSGYSSSSSSSSHLSRYEVQGIVLRRGLLPLAGPLPSRALSPHVRSAAVIRPGRRLRLVCGRAARVKRGHAEQAGSLSRIRSNTSSCTGTDSRLTNPRQAAAARAYLTRMVHLSDVNLRFEIWDTAGQEKYHSVTPLYYRGAHAAILVYDISKRETFLRAQVWLRELEQQVIPGSTVLWLVGNKGDLAEERQVSVQEGQGLASDRGLFFSETSAMSGFQVNELLAAIAHSVYECVGAQQEGLSEWRETPVVNLHHRDTLTSAAPCCRVGP
ncbi:ras-related protein Rab-42-like [Hippoglossus hippoglossus]|uniref:ras-related protein Rab-42-like n=1 Tax=Hippoglossus hippoglossus TaxID=8267 RepID=UPI00148CBD39|nr:ras-related protein Rab-42-like [Hippoglossus hippoglossus]